MSYLDPHGKIADTRFFFLLRVISLSGVTPLWKNQNKSDACHNLWTMCMLGFEISYMDSSWKNSWPILFSCLSSLPFWSYAPLTKSEWNLVRKIIWKVFELGLETWSADRGWWVEYLIKLKKKSSSYFFVVTALWKFGHFKLVCKISRKVFDLRLETWSADWVW